MTRTTYYVVQPYRLIEGEVVPGEPFEVRSADAARTSARRAGTGEDRGAVAFCRTGDPSSGDFDDAEILLRAGIVPDEFAAPAR